MERQDLPFLDLTATGFSTRSPEVLAARTAAPFARTPFGIAVLRHHEAGLILRDRRLRQGSHNWPDLQDLQGSFAGFWRRSIISQEGAAHKALRHVAMAALSADFVSGLKPDFRVVAEGLVAKMPRDETIEFISDFSEPFAGLAITRLLGLPDADATALAHDASRLGLAMGIGAKAQEPVFNAACDRLMGLADHLIARVREGEDRTHFVARLVGGAGDLSDQELRNLIVIAIFGGVDTTRAQLGFAIGLFIEHPAEWQALRDDPGLIPNAIEEVIRTRPTTTWATRQALEDLEISGTTIRRGEVVHVLVHASGRDPAVVADQRFDIQVPRKIHFGFGGGAHHCLGQFVARTDMAEALAVLAENWRSITWDGTPEWLPDSGNTSPVSLPIRPVWD